MSLFGALTSGVSGLSAQSSAMGTIADNITNVNTVGYKGTTVDFQTLVTRQGSQTRYSAGGVQASAQGNVNVQGLLQSSSSTTDLALSGNGFFLVNRSSEPTATDPYLFTRAGSFSTDAEDSCATERAITCRAGQPTALARSCCPTAAPPR